MVKRGKSYRSESKNAPMCRDWWVGQDHKSDLRESSIRVGVLGQRGQGELSDARLGVGVLS